MQLLKAKTPSIFKKMFPDYVWEIPVNNSNDKVLYLTFDDGPTPDITEKVLDILSQNNAKATFFCIGKNIERYPRVFQRILDQDHAIGNHTYKHLKGWKTTIKNYIDDTLQAEETIQQINKSVNQQKLFRPPYGKLKPSQGKALQKLGYKIIMWDVLSYDWDNSLTIEKVLSNVINNTKSGSIIVFHDSDKAATKMLYILPKVLEYFSKKGYLFKKIK